MMNFIRNNIVKILIVLVVLIILVVIITACSKSSPVQTKETGYSEMENKVQNAAIRLTNKNKTLLPKRVDTPRIIKLKTLIKNNLVSEFHAIEDSKVKCTGYVEVMKKYEDQEDYRYTPYIKCGKYYETKTIGNYIISNEPVVTKGQGLYQVEIEAPKTTIVKTEDNKEVTETTPGVYSYYFKGEYPNNYLRINNRMYRIMEVTEDGNLKVISTERTADSYIWDDRYNSEKDNYVGINDFSKSRIKDNLEFIYSNVDEEAGEVYFSQLEREYIVSHDFCTGKRSANDVALYSKTECDAKEELHVGLVSLNDYFRVSTSSKCTGVDKLDCNNYNYIYSINPGKSVILMTLTSNLDDTFNNYQVYYGDLVLKKCNYNRRVYPVVYLDSSLLYKSGSGTSKDPYIIR